MKYFIRQLGYYEEKEEYKIDLLNECYWKELEEIKKNMPISMKDIVDKYYFHDNYLLSMNLNKESNSLSFEILILKNNDTTDKFYKGNITFLGFDEDYSLIPDMESNEYLWIGDHEFCFNNYSKKYEFYFRTAGRPEEIWLTATNREFKFVFDDMKITELSEDTDGFWKNLKSKKMRELF
jgi:hypothetical protein